MAARTSSGAQGVTSAQWPHSKKTADRATATGTTRRAILGRPVPVGLRACPAQSTPIATTWMRRCIGTGPTPAASSAPLTSASDVRLSGWLHNRRDLGGILFIDLRDHYGITQLVARPGTAGRRGPRQADQGDRRPRRRQGRLARRRQRQPRAADRRDRDRGRRGRGARRRRSRCPFTINADDGVNEERRLEYRFLDLRRERMHRNIMLRSAVIASIRSKMVALGFNEMATPILTATSPEGARDFLVPSRLQPGQVLRAAAGAAAVQAAADDLGLRPLLPDRALLPRRGRPRGPLAGRVLPARRRDELRRAGGRLPADREADDRALRGVRQRPPRHLAVPAHPVPRVDAEVRLRQAGPARPARTGRRLGRLRGLRLQGVRRQARARAARAGHRGAVPQVLRRPR